MKKRKILVSVFLMVAMVLFQCMPLMAATVGQQLKAAEQGWNRYDETDTNFKYTGKWDWLSKSHRNYGRHYNKGMISTASNGVLSFVFYGTKLRIIDDFCSNRCGNCAISFDNGETWQSYNTYLEDKYYKDQLQLVVYESPTLEEGIHQVQIKKSASNAGGILGIDAIDLMGYILPPDTTPMIFDIEFPINRNPVQTTTSSAPSGDSLKEVKIPIDQTATASLFIENTKEIAAEDVRVTYDTSKLKYTGCKEVAGIRLVYSNEASGELRFILASQGSTNIVNSKKSLLELYFKGIAPGKALVDVTRGRISDGIEMEKDVLEKQCGEGTIIIEGTAISNDDVNHSGEFTLLDLGIDARHLGKDPKAEEVATYNTDIAINDAIDDEDLLTIGQLMLKNTNYPFNH